MKEIIKQADIELKKIKGAMETGLISYDEAKQKAEVPLKVINDEGAKVSKAFGRKPYKITFTSIMR
jgi:hypothetical protein